MNNTIQGIILDIDGVIIGKKKDFNFPFPHGDVIQALKTIHSKGIPIILCTARPSFGIIKIIEQAKLDTVHITEGGAVIINLLQQKIIQKHSIKNNIATLLAEQLIKNSIYTELYNTDTYFVQRNRISSFTKQHGDILQVNPHVISSLVDQSKQMENIKIIVIVKNEEEKNMVVKMCKPYQKDIMLNWTLHPTMAQAQFGVITALNVSKKEGFLFVSKYLHIPFDHFLGVGDTGDDWKFIEFCKYGATLQNGTNEIKKKVLSKEKEYGYIGPSVDENGVIDIFRYFSLL